MGASMTMDGVGAIADALDMFGRVRTRAVLRTSLRREAKLVAGKAAGKIRHRTGAMKRRLKVRAGKRDAHAVSVVVLTDGAEASHLELGHRMGARGRGNSRGVVEPFPFLRPAFDETARAAEQRIIEDLDSLIAETLAKGSA